MQDTKTIIRKLQIEAQNLDGVDNLNEYICYQLYMNNKHTKSQLKKLHGKLEAIQDMITKEELEYIRTRIEEII